MLSLTQTTPPAAEPVTREEAKLWARVSGAAEDALIDELVAAARAQVEGMVPCQLVTASWTLSLDGFPTSTRREPDRAFPDVSRASVAEIVLPYPPLQSVTTVTYIDPDGNPQVLSSALYTIDTAALPGRLRLAYGSTWPAVRRQPGAVTIVYVAGFGTPAAVPSYAKIAVKMLVADAYDHRDRGAGAADDKRVRDLLAELWNTP